MITKILIILPNAERENMHACVHTVHKLMENFYNKKLNEFLFLEYCWHTHWINFPIDYNISRSEFKQYIPTPQYVYKNAV